MIKNIGTLPIIITILPILFKKYWDENPTALKLSLIAPESF
jgi:hypothetical protein